MLSSLQVQQRRLDDLYGSYALEEVYDLELSGRVGRGIDRVGPEAFEQMKATACSIASDKVRSGTYRMSAYLEKLATKGRDKLPRVISIATRRDQLVLLQLKNLLHEIFPDRVGRQLPNEHIRQLKSFNPGLPLCDLSVLRADIRGFYDNIDHKRLLEMVNVRVLDGRARDLVRRSIRSPTVTHGGRSSRSARNRRGVPQGLSISNILAGIYVESIDAAFQNSALHYARYVDDILIIAPTSAIAAARSQLELLLQTLGLELNEKTGVVRADEPFEFLSYRMRLPQVSVRRSAIERLVSDIAAQLSAFKHGAASAPQWLAPSVRSHALIEEVNERITGAISEKRKYGWIFFYLELEDRAVLHQIDATIDALFARSAAFGHRRPVGLKRLSRSYFEARYNTSGGYIHDYNKYSTPQEKSQLLVERGVLDPARVPRLSALEINSMYQRYRTKRLSKLEYDVGVIS